MTDQKGINMNKEIERAIEKIGDINTENCININSLADIDIGDIVELGQIIDDIDIQYYLDEKGEGSVVFLDTETEMLQIYYQAVYNTAVYNYYEEVEHITPEMKGELVTYESESEIKVRITQIEFRDFEL